MSAKKNCERHIDFVCIYVLWKLKKRTDHVEFAENGTVRVIF